MRTRLTTNPGVSWQRIGRLPSRSPTAKAASTAASEESSALHDLDERHQGRRVEEVHADDPLRRGDGGGDLGDRERRRVGREDRVRTHDPLELGEERVLGVEILDDRLDHEVAVRKGGELGREGRAAREPPTARRSSFAPCRPSAGESARSDRAPSRRAPRSPRARRSRSPLRSPAARCRRPWRPGRRRRSCGSRERSRRASLTGAAARRLDQLSERLRCGLLVDARVHAEESTRAARRSTRNTMRRYPSTYCILRLSLDQHQSRYVCFRSVRLMQDNVVRVARRLRRWPVPGRCTSSRCRSAPRGDRARSARSP